MNKMLAAAEDSSLLSEINITPFTDVLLVLLIIFMILAALLVPPGFEKQLANGGKAHPATAVHQIVVSIDRYGVIVFNGNHTTAQGLYADMARAGARAHVSLIADAHAPYGLALRVLDAAKMAGISDVAFITQ